MSKGAAAKRQHLTQGLHITLINPSQNTFYGHCIFRVANKAMATPQESTQQLYRQQSQYHFRLRTYRKSKMRRTQQRLRLPPFPFYPCGELWPVRVLR